MTNNLLEDARLQGIESVLRCQIERLTAESVEQKKLLKEMADAVMEWEPSDWTFRRKPKRIAWWAKYKSLIERAREMQ
jgi:hypothetical protein